MKQATAALLVLTLLAACGADGDPLTPTMNSTVSVGTSGVSANTNIGVRRGPWTLGVNL